MIANDWSVAKIALQILAERGPGKAIALAESAENAAMKRLARAVRTH